jgi:hypothetical protein
MHDKPLVVCDPDGAFVHLRAQVEQIVEQGFARPTIWSALTWVNTPAQALDAVEEQVAARDRQPAPTAGEVLEAEPSTEA